MDEQKDYSATRQPRSNCKKFGHSYQDFQLIKLLHQSSLELFQVMEALQLSSFAEVHHAEHDNSVMISVCARLPHALQRKLPLDRRHAAKSVQQLLLQ